MRKIVFLGLTLSCGLAMAGDFKKGPLIKEFGPHAQVQHNDKLNNQTRFKLAFDVADKAEPGKVNRKFESLARFLNMQVANGVPADSIELALIVHGKASEDLLNQAEYQKRNSTENANAALLSQLAKYGVDIRVCGQSASYYKIDNELLLPEVTMSLSAMTAHALLQQQGYTVNPF